MATIEKTNGRRITLKDIAKRLDVSHATVSRALNRAEDPLISEATRMRVQQVAAGGWGIAPITRKRGRWQRAVPVWSRCGYGRKPCRIRINANVSQLMAMPKPQIRSYQLLVNLVVQSDGTGAAEGQPIRRLACGRNHRPS